MKGKLAGKRVAAYARYSSAMQNETSIDDQIRRCRSYAEHHGAMISEDLIFTDEAISGASLERAGLEQLMSLVRSTPRGVDVIITEDLSRISRDFAGSARLFKQFNYFEVPLIGIADGIDTAAKGAKLAFTVKSLLSDMYLDELADKTLRGLEGRALKGYSTGGLPMGYRSEPDLDADGRELGKKVLVDSDAAEIIRRIFSLYLDGHSIAGIAGILNEEQVPPPRAKTKHRCKGWVAGTIREMLRNEAYIGWWTFKRRKWRKVPGTNKRRPKNRPAADVIRQHFPERQIIDDDTWAAVKRRREAVAARYSGKRKGTAPGKRTRYPLSGLLICAACGANMVLNGGSSARYYVCGDSKKRKNCNNRMSVREDVARQRIFGALKARFTRPAAVTYLRARIAEKLGELERSMNTELTERRDRLARIESRLENLVAFIAAGRDSRTVEKAIADNEAHAKAEREAIAALEAHAKAPISLPTPDAIVERALDLDAMLAGAPLRAREALRRFFQGGNIILTPDHEKGHYVAKAEFLPLVALSELAANKITKPPAGSRGPSGTSVGCAGRI